MTALVELDMSHSLVQDVQARAKALLCKRPPLRRLVVPVGVSERFAASSSVSVLVVFVLCMRFAVAVLDRALRRLTARLLSSRSRCSV
jgi:hypothetical protein